MPTTITPTKTARTLQSSAANAAAATTNGTALDLTTKRGGLATLVVTNGATAPTVGCTAAVQVSADNVNWYDWTAQTASVVNSDVNVFQVQVPEAVMYVRSQFRGNTGQSVTVLAIFQEYTSDSAS